MRSVAKRECEPKTNWPMMRPAPTRMSWLNDACVTPQRWPCHELVWIWTDFLSKQRQATDLVETAAGQAWNDRLHNARVTWQDSRWVRNSFHGKNISILLYGRACTGACAFFAGSVVCIQVQTGVLSTMHTQVFMSTGVVCISVHTCVHARYRMCICAHVCAVCSFSVGEWGWGGSTSLWGHMLLGVGGYFW